ncbi:hypothetical protein ABPG73_022282 [Tetrahymena malaccensis]
MNTSFESSKKGKIRKQKSIFSQQSRQLEDDNSDCQQSCEDKIDRSCQRYLFEIKPYQLEQGHQGDQDISDNGSVVDQNVTIQNIKEQQIQNQLKIEIPILNEKNDVIQTAPFSKNNSNIQQISKFDMSFNNESSSIIQNKEPLQSTSQQNTFHQQSLMNQKTPKIKTDSFTAQKYQTNISINQNIVSSHSNMKRNEKESKEKDQSIVIYQKNEGLIYEDFIYEKNLANLNRKMTCAVMKIQQKATLTQKKHQQRYQQATNIINKLLNNSMNRIMRVKQHVQYFVVLLKQRLLHKQVSNLTYKDYMTINDLCFFYKQHQKKKQNSFLQKYVHLLFKFTKSIPIFMPTDTMRVIWDVFQVIFTYIFLYFYSILMFFNQDNPDSQFIETFFFYAFFLFLVDILINFNTAYFDKDTIIQKRKLIAKQYIFSTLFLTDCASLMVQASKVIYKSSSIVYNPNHNLLVYGFNMLIFLKINGMSPKQKRFYYVFTLKESQKHIIKLINQLVSVITVAHIAQEQKDRNKESEDQIISILSNKLRDEITVEINSKILNNYHVFSSNFSQTTLKKLVFRMKEVLVSPNEIIFSDEQYDDLSIYFIQKGVIEIYQQPIMKQGKANVISTLSDNQLFGEMSFFSGLSRKASARSVNLSTLYKISREDFLEVLKENDEDFERFKMMQEQINFQSELQILYTECYTCKQVGHIAQNCPKTHHLFDKQFLVLKNNISFFQDRAYLERRQMRIKQKASFLAQKNVNICNALKENLEDLNTEVYFMFNTEENLNGSEFTISEDQEDDEEEEEEDDDSDIKSQQTFKSQKSASASQKNLKKTTKSAKNANISPQKINKNNYFNENEQAFEAQQKDKTILANENQDSNKNIPSSQNKMNSMEIKENYTSHLITEQSNNSSNLNNPTQQENKQSQKRDSISQNSNATDIQQLQSNDSIEQGARSPGKNKKQKNLTSKNKNISNNIQYSFNINKVSNKFIEENNSENQVIEFQKQQPGSDRISQVLSQYQSSFNNSKRLFSQNSTKTLNFDNTEFRCSIDQILLQGVIANTILQAQRQSITQKKSNNQQSILQDVLEKNSYSKSRNEICEADSNPNKKLGSNRSIIDHREEKSCKNLSNLNPISRSNSSNINNNNNKPNSNSNVNNTNNTVNKKKLSENNQIIEDMKFVERFSRLMQTTQLPLLLQYTSGLSLKEFHSMNNINSMDFFDKMQNFKKFFPRNNFEKVISNLKFIQQEQKKIKKQKLCQKQRRQNVVLPFNQTKISNNNINSAFIFGQQDFNIDQYKPTYLSYGVAMRNGLTYPKNNFS